MFFLRGWWTIKSCDKFDLVTIQGPFLCKVFCNLKWYSNSRDEMLLFFFQMFCSCKFFRRSREGGWTSKRQNKCNRFISGPVARNRFKKSEASYLENLHSRALKGGKLISQSLRPVVLIYHVSLNFRRFRNLDLFFVQLNEQILWLKSDRTHNVSPTNVNLHRLSKLH